MKVFALLILSVGFSAQAQIISFYRRPPLNTPIKVWAALNPEARCKFVFSEPEQKCEAPRGNLFHSYGDEARQQILHYVDAKTNETKNCRMSANSMVTVVGYGAGSNGTQASISYRNSKKLADKAWHFFDMSELPVKRAQNNAGDPLCKDGDNYFLDEYELGFFWDWTLDQDFGLISNYQLGRKANPYEKPLPTHQIDALTENDQMLGVVVHGWAALQDADKIIERFDAEKAKEILRTGSPAHPGQSVFSNAAYKWNIDYRVGDRYFELNGECLDYSEMRYRRVDSSLCAK